MHTPSAVKRLPAFFAALAIVAGSLVISTAIVYQFVNPKLFTIETTLAMVVFLVLVLYPLAVWQRLWKQPAAWGLKLFLFGILLSTLFSIDRTTSWFGNIDRGTGAFFLLILTVAACALGSVLDKAQARAYILKPIALSGTLIAASTYLGGLGWKVLQTATGPEIGGLLGNSSIAGTYLLMAFFITGYLLLSATKLSAKWLYGIALAVMCINPVFINLPVIGKQYHGLFSLVGDAKGAALSILFGLAIAMAAYFITATRRRSKIIGTMLMAALLLGAAIGIVSLAMPTTRLHAWFVSKETDSRFVAWNIAIQGFRAHPVVGSGPETFGYTYQTYFNPIIMLPSHSAEEWANKPHNAYLQVLSETGLIGAIGYLALLVGLFFSLAKAYRHDKDKKFFIAMVGLCAAYLLNNLIFFDTVTSYVLLFMLIAAVIAASPHEYPRAIKSLPWEKALRYAVAAGIVALVTAVVSAQLAKTYRAHEEFLLPLDHRTVWYQKVEDTASYGSALFIAQRADFTYQSVFFPSLGQILQQNPTNKAIATGGIQGLIDTMQHSFQKYPLNEQGELSIGRLASIKMVIANAPDAASLATMQAAAKAAIVISPTNPNGHILLGQEYVYEQKYEDAYAQFEIARAMVPLLAQPHVALINLAQLLHDTGKMNFFIQRARQESPDFAANFK